MNGYNKYVIMGISKLFPRISMMYNIPIGIKPVNKGHARLLRMVHLIHIEKGFISTTHIRSVLYL